MVLLEVRDLKMYYRAFGGWIRAVDGISFELERGSTLGLVGESGCGKSSVGLSLLKLLPPTAKFMSGEILFDGTDLLNLCPEDIRKIRWKRISMIFQNAMNALDPVKKVGDQLMEALTVNVNVRKDEAKKKAVELFERVGLSADRMNSYPHELSGGMKQRVIIAMALVCNPELIIADEPTTALDVVVQDQIMQLILELKEKFNLSIIFISHSASVIAETCERICVMYGGKIVEQADVRSIFKSPYHPYTISLFYSYPSIVGEVKKLISLPGAPPNLLNPPAGCRFAPRCPIAKKVCKAEEPPKFEVKKGHYSHCHFAMELDVRKIQSMLEGLT
ncbi:ABC transporter ATP-binding protein [Candidatus Bathyarchaeota archaeon]|nr:ABC transporter ATP-binding protein [Candidatus Bathyarchaeota archaeon]